MDRKQKKKDPTALFVLGEQTMHSKRAGMSYLTFLIRIHKCTGLTQSTHSLNFTFRAAIMNWPQTPEASHRLPRKCPDGAEMNRM